MVELKTELFDALASVDRLRAETAFDRALAEAPPLTVIETLIVPVLADLGEAWQEGRIALSQIYIGARVCEEMVARALPTPDRGQDGAPCGAIVVLCDYHMLGKRIVGSILRASGVALRDYGRMEVDALVDRVVADRLDILLISTLMLPAALKVREVRDGLARRGHRPRIAVGGAPFRFDPTLWQAVGADAMGETAADAIPIVQRWTESPR